MTTIATLTPIELEADCSFETCREFASPLYEQLSSGYELCSVMRLPDSLEDWRADHRTARKRANRAERLGYRFAEIRREEYGDDIYAVNTSLARRQGRPMTAGYRELQEFLPLPAYECPRHAIRTYGVLAGETLVAYLWLYRAGELALVSSILGHGDHLRNDVMYLLVQGAIKREVEWDGYLVYNRHDSGTDGLRYFKERIGLEEAAVVWLP